MGYDMGYDMGGFKPLTLARTLAEGTGLLHAKVGPTPCACTCVLSVCVCACVRMCLISRNIHPREGYIRSLHSLAAGASTWHGGF